MKKKKKKIVKKKKIDNISSKMAKKQLRKFF